MGAANTKNTADAVTRVANYVDNSTTANSDQISKVKSSQTLKNCTLIIDGDVNMDQSSSIYVKNTQIAAAKSDTNLENNIQQKMLQEATSTVGSMGVGYANASNAASMFASSSNDIRNAVQTSASQYAKTDQSWTCDGSYIRAKNLNVSFNSSQNFLSDQTLKNDNVTKVVNSVSQSITQKATAKVEGLAGFIIAIAILIAAFGYTIAKPLTTGPFKMLMGVIIIIALIGIGIWMYLASAPPLFNDDNMCAPNSNLGGCDGDCINLQNKKIHLEKPPLKYLFGLLQGDISDPGGNLLQMVVASKAGVNTSGDNGGYRIDTASEINNLISNTYAKIAQNFSIPNVPDILINPSETDYYSIPVEYRLSAGTGAKPSLCTPKILQVGGENTTLSNCPTMIKGSALNTTTDKTQGIANLNITAWQTYLKGPTIETNTDTKELRALWARYVLCDMIGNIDLNVYVNENEIIKYKTEDDTIKITRAKDSDGNGYKYIPNNITNFRNGVIGQGVIHGKFGICNDKTYKFHKFSRNVGIWLFLLLVLFVFGFIIFTHYKNKSK